jgi:hypothetical protein
MFINTNDNLSRSRSVIGSQKKSSESGAALATAILMLALLSAIAMTVLAVVRTETRIAGSDLKRTQTFYAAASGIEKMTSDFSQLFTKTSRPTQAQLDRIKNSPPTGLSAEGYTLIQDLAVDQTTLDAMKTTQGIPLSSTTLPNAVMGADSPFAGLNASINPFTLNTRATNTDGTQVALTRQMNNYLIPIFQFGVFTDKDLEFWPQPPMTFNGRIHANGNIYLGGDITFLQRVTTANEMVRDRLRNDAVNDTMVGGGFSSIPRFKLNSSTTVYLNQGYGSVLNGPKLSPQPRADGRGDFPTSPAGTDNPWWKTNSKTTFGGLALSKSTGVLPLKLPLQLAEVNKQPLELIKRTMPDDSLPGFDALNDSRYQTKAQIRILIDDENAGTGAANAAGIPAGKGVLLSAFVPSVLDGGNALRVVTDAGAYASTADWLQGDPARNLKAQTVRAVRDYSGLISGTAKILTGTTGTGGTNATTAAHDTANANPLILKSPNGAIIPPGSGIKGRILIEIVPPVLADGTQPDPIDVTQAILSMGVTVGEPNAIVQLQRPAWAALMQGSRDRKGDATHHDYLTYFLVNSVSDRRALADGEIRQDVAFNSSGYISSIDNVLDDDGVHLAAVPFLPALGSMSRDDKPGPALNKIVPINVYNVREGHVDEASSATVPYQRGITSVVEINMRNLARWVDGAYDNTLFTGLPAASSPVSTSIAGTDGYVVYVSDRRGDRIKGERNAAGSTIQTTNGMADNEDIYNVTTGPTLDAGEDAIDEGYDPVAGTNKKNSLQIDKCELPTQAAITSTGAARPSGAVTAGVDSTRYALGVTVTEWNKALPASMSATTAPCTAVYAAANQYWFRRAVRLFNGEDMKTSTATGKLSPTKGISISSENMVYIWGNYNTTGINQVPPSGESSLNDSAAASRYNGNQVPASIVADAVFPLSKTWYDALPAMYPEGANTRVADAGALLDTDGVAITDETAVRAGFIAGSTLSSMTSVSPPAYYLDNLNGGVHNFPRFLETWSGINASSSFYTKRWNYVGSFIILYNSLQAMSPWSVASSVVYYPPTRNWAFDITFTDPMKLPPGTPQFQHIEPTGFRQIL